MDVLVDYYNLSQQHRRRGIVHVVDRIISAIVHDHLSAAERRIDFRLYGGWYDEQIPTSDAQTIAATLISHFPKLILSAPDRRRIVVSAELAYSLKCDPEHHLWYTLRSKAAPRGIVFVDPATAGCRKIDSCPLRPGYDFFVDGRCPEQDCVVEPPLVIRRREQKLVDTMLAADVLFNTRADERRIAVVSSDEDLWPAIRMALQCGLYVVHVHTEKGRITRAEYVRGKQAGYVQLNLQEGADGFP